MSSLASFDLALLQKQNVTTTEIYWTNLTLPTISSISDCVSDELVLFPSKLEVIYNLPVQCSNSLGKSITY